VKTSIFQKMKYVVDYVVDWSKNGWNCGGEREGRSKIQKWALFWDIYGPGESNVLSTDIDLDTLPRCPGICAFNI
jgi:hypothetical protein